MSTDNKKKTMAKKMAKGDVPLSLVTHFNGKPIKHSAYGHGIDNKTGKRVLFKKKGY